MITIDQKDLNGNPKDEASSAEGRAEGTTADTERKEKARESSDATNHDGAVADITAENTEGHATPSALRGLTALACLRTCVEEHGTSPELERALSKLDDVLRRPRVGLTEPRDNTPPASAMRRADEGSGSNGDNPVPTSPVLSPPMSRLAVRHDGALLVTLEDADDRDLTGREIVQCMVLSADEVARALTSADNALSDAAAGIIGHLPKRST